MNRKIRREWWLGVVLLAVWAVVYLPALSWPALLDDADTVHAEAAREMLLRHDWVTLHVNGIRYLEKAPLLYWITAFFYKAFGVTEWTTRLPLALGVLLLMGAVFGLGRRAYGEWGGFYAALVVATSLGLFVYTRFMIPDVYVALWLALGMWCFYEMLGQERPSVWWCWGLAATTALNVLTKGLIGLVFPGLIVLVYLVLTGRLSWLARMRWVSSVLVFLLIAAPWHVMAALRNPAQPSGPEKGFLWFYFIDDQFLRYLNQRVPRDYDTVPLLLFWFLVLVWVFPWSSYLPIALRELPGWRAWRTGKLSRRQQVTLLLVVWTVVIVGFFSFSTRQEYYTLPVVPAVALLLGGWLQREQEVAEEAGRKASLRVSAALAVVGLVLGGVALLLWWRTSPLPAGVDLADLLTEHPGKYALSLGHLEDLTLPALGAFHGPLLAVAVAFLVGCGLNWWLRRRRSLLAANLVLAAMTIVLLLAVQQAYARFNPILSSKDLALTLQRYLRPEDVVVIHGDYEWGSSVPFYTGHPVFLWHGRQADLWFGSLFPDAPRIFLDEAGFVRLWKGPQRVFLFTPDFNREQALAPLDPASVHLVARTGGKFLYCNRPVGFGAAAPAGSQ